MKLLHECIGSSVLTGKYCMLVMKCIWKVEISSQVVSLSFGTCSGDPGVAVLARSRHGCLSPSRRSSLLPCLLPRLLLETTGLDMLLPV